MPSYINIREEPMSFFNNIVRECVALMLFLRHAVFMLAALGVFRILIGAIGVPETVGTWISSGTLLAMTLTVYYAHSAPSNGFNKYWQFVFIGFFISVVQSLVVIAGIGITTNLGIASYFGSERVSVNRHIMGHLGSAIGGNMTIPLVILAGFGFAIGQLRKRSSSNGSA